MAVRWSTFCEMINTPGLCVAVTNAAKARGIVFRSWETRIRPSEAARASTSGSLRRRSSPPTAVRKSIAGSRRRTPFTTSWLRSASARNQIFIFAWRALAGALPRVSGRGGD